MAKMILLVDDDIDFVTVNKIALEAAGYKVVTAHDGQQAMKAACDNPIDGAVLDVMMTTPDEGFVLAREMRADPRTSKVPLVMLTSINEVNRSKGFPFHLSDRDRDDLWLPVDRFLDKPVTGEKLVATVREIVG